MILNAEENKNLFRKNLQDYINSIEDEDWYFSHADYYEYLLSLPEYKSIDFMIEDGEFKGIIAKSIVEGITFIDLTGDFDDNIYEIISQKYKDALISIQYWSSDKPFEYYNLADFTSSNGGEIYSTPCSVSFLVPKHMSEYILRDKIEELYRPKFNEDKLTFEDKTGYEILQETIKKYKNNPFFNGFSRSLNGNIHVAGFYYFGLDESDRNQKILLCKLNGEIIGAIKHGLYGGYGGMPHQGLAYIDVNINYRNRGIAKKMIKELDKHLDRTLPLFLTDESDLGKICHMERLFVENIHSTDCVPYSEQYNYCKQNAEKLEQLKSYYNKITNKDKER